MPNQTIRAGLIPTATVSAGIIPTATTDSRAETIPTATANSDPAKNNKFWNFIPQNYETNTPAELVLYGEISSTSWYDDDITPTLFDKELKELGDVDEITVRINSGGGDVFAANAIYTRLKDHKATITVKIDGWAASAATIIAMAGDTILIPANGVFMIHNPQMMSWGYYEAKDFVKLAEELEIIKQSIINGYVLRTGKTEDEISSLMDNETWLDGKQAVESGFCTGIMFGEVDTAVENSNRVVVNSVSLDISKCGYKNLPKTLLNCRSSGDFTNTKTPPTPNNKKEMKKMEEEIKTADQLKAAYPELTAQIENAAVAVERKRIKDIESVSLDGYEEITNAAKYDNPVDSGEFALQILAAQKKQNKKYAADLEADIEDSGIVGAGVENKEPLNDSDEDNPYMKAIEKFLPARKEG